MLGCFFEVSSLSTSIVSISAGFSLLDKSLKLCPSFWNKFETFLLGCLFAVAISLGFSLAASRLNCSPRFWNKLSFFLIKWGLSAVNFKTAIFAAEHFVSYHVCLLIALVCLIKHLDASNFWWLTQTLEMKRVPMLFFIGRDSVSYFGRGKPKCTQRLLR